MLTNLLLPAFTSAQNVILNQPENLDQAKQMGQNALEVIKNDSSGIIKNIWNNEVLPVWKKMFDWAKVHLWQNWLKTWFDNIWQAVKRIFTSEVEQRTPTVKENFQTEKGQLKEEVPEVGKSLWEKFKELIK